MPNAILEKIYLPSHCWSVNATDRTVRLVTMRGATPDERSTLMAETLAENVLRGRLEVLKGWRNELYPVYGPEGEFLFEMERAASSLFGIVTYGVHMTGYVEDEEKGLMVWVPRRSRTKQTFPSMLDNTVAGGMSTGERPFECAVREGMEEASLPEDIVKNHARSTGCVSYVYVRDSRAGGETDLLQPEVEYVYDIKLPVDVVPKPCDSEVQEFHLWTIEQCKQALANREFKPNCAVILIDFFIRHGILTPKNEPDYLQIIARLHRLLEFPTASLST